MISSCKVLAGRLLLLFLVCGCFSDAHALPAFARKYGLRCSACHESWPALNWFGLKFRDNGYQIMNDRDAPIWQNPSYWPATFRMTPIWHRVSVVQSVDTYNTDGSSNPNAALQRVSSTGFDLSGLDFHTGGTLEKNISFYLLPSSDATGAFHFETVMARFDNLFNSPWLNIKMGKFELNNLLSEKRILTLTGNGGVYQTYHFSGVGDGNIYGQMGDNQLGIEYLGHSYNDRTRISAALLSSSDGNVGLITGANSYMGFFTADQGIDLGRMGVSRVGFYAMVGQAATYFLTSGGAPIAGSGIGNKGFSREGFTGEFYFGEHFDLNIVTQHGSDNAWFGQGYGNAINPSNGSQGPPLPNNTPYTVLATGAQAPTWNGATFEARYLYSPQLMFLARVEVERMSQQANGAGCTATVLPGTPACQFTVAPYGTGPAPSNFGNITNYVIGYRYNPFMTSRAGFAWHNEFNFFHQDGTGPTSPAGFATDINMSELLIGFDFDF